MIIYKIWNIDNPDKFYIGSSKRDADWRLNRHYLDYRRYKRGKFPFVSVFDIDFRNRDKVKIKVVEKCKNALHMLDREAYHIKRNDCVNRNIPSGGKTKNILCKKCKCRIHHAHYKRHLQSTKHKKK